MINLQFPDGITWTQTTNGNLYDLYGNTYKPTTLDSAYSGSRRRVVKIEYDTSEVIGMSSIFNGCSNLISVPQFNTSKVTSMGNAFKGCSNLISVPQFNTSKVTSMGSAFEGCFKLKTIPQLDMSSLTGSLSSMFYNCSKLEEIPDLNCSGVSDFGISSYSSWVYGCSNLWKIGVLDCDNISNVSYMLGNGNRPNLTTLGGFRNLGKRSSVSNTKSNYFLYYAPNLTYESVMNVINLLYDRASAGLSVLTLKLHPNHLAMLSEDDIAIATNKGWTLV